VVQGVCADVVVDYAFEVAGIVVAEDVVASVWLGLLVHHFPRKLIDWLHIQSVEEARGSAG
jgi:hypothetical protein